MSAIFRWSLLSGGRKDRFDCSFLCFFIEKITFRHKASSDLMSDGRSEEMDIQKGRYGTWQISK